MEKHLKDLLPTQQHPAHSLPQSEELPIILTEDEKKTALDWSIGLLKKQQAAKLADKGLSAQEILSRLSQVNWMEQIDPAHELKMANQRKHWAEDDRIAKEIAQEKAIADRQALLAEWDANKFYNVIKRHFLLKHGRFVKNASNEHLIKTVCFFLSNDPRFESELGYSFRKGLLVQGTAGLGKTETLRAVSNNPLYKIRIMSMIDIADQVRERGECEISQRGLILLDDVGTEPEVVNHYGTKINWFKDFIEGYYLNNSYHGQTFAGLLVTTNLGGDEIESRYGYRVRSRVREMFNVIQVSGTDLRK